MLSIVNVSNSHAYTAQFFFYFSPSRLFASQIVQYALRVASNVSQFHPI